MSPEFSTSSDLPATTDETRPVDLLDRLAAWVGALGRDAELVAAQVESPDTVPEVRERLVSGLNYLVKSLDLIDDGVETLGFLDDALVLRVTLGLARGAIPEALLDLRGQVGGAREFLGELAPRFERFVEGLSELSVHGHTAEELLGDEEKLATFLAEIKRFAARYEPPPFARDPSVLVKAHAFLDTKLPR